MLSLDDLSFHFAHASFNPFNLPHFRPFVFRKAGAPWKRKNISCDVSGIPGYTICMYRYYLLPFLSICRQLCEHWWLRRSPMRAVQWANIVLLDVICGRRPVVLVFYDESARRCTRTHGLFFFLNFTSSSFLKKFNCIIYVYLLLSFNLGTPLFMALFVNARTHA